MRANPKIKIIKKNSVEIRKKPSITEKPVKLKTENETVSTVKNRVNDYRRQHSRGKIKFRTLFAESI